ncbi:MAG: hypothetical protein K2K12_05160 [Clostridia bacterium]|nr:hypothetical protein [Clostridia bacterium]
MATYTFKYKNITRELPVHEVGSGMKIAYLDTLSDYELVTALSKDMAELIAKNSRVSKASRVVLFTAESKGVPFAYAVANALCGSGKSVEVVIARKHEKKFFGKCVSTEKFSITTEAVNDKLFVTEYDKEKLEGAEVVLVDDFYSTGASMNALENLAAACNAEVIERVVAVWEEVDGNKPNVKFVTTLPIL